MSHINSSKSSGAKIADGVILDQPGKLTSVILTGDGTNAATLLVYDNASAASGTLLASLSVDAGLVYESFCPHFPIDALNGIYIDIGGTGASAIVHYQAG